MTHETWIRASTINSTPAHLEEEKFAMNIERDLGRLEQIARNLEHTIIELKRERDELRDKIKDLEDKFSAEMTSLRDLISQAKGGYRVVLWVGALISSVSGAAFIKFILPLFMR
jgi:predicted  nucleic acid-binding Zn-ribbon protein